MKSHVISSPSDMPVGVRAPIEGVVYPPPAELERYVREGALGHETLVDAFRQVVERYPDHVALQGLDWRMTYAELDSRSTRLAAALLRQGLRPLDRVLFQLGDSEQLVTAFLACLKATLIPICTLAAHREREMSYLANHAGATLHLVQGDDPKFDGVAFARKMQGEASTLRIILQARGEPQEGVLHLETLIRDMPDEEARRVLADIDVDPFQVAVFQLSGGTTGVPKIIPRFHNDYVHNMRAVAAYLRYRSDDILFMPQPMVHNLNMSCCFGPFLLTGGTVLVAPDLQPETLVSLVADARPTWLMLGGPIIARVETAIRQGRVDLSGVRGVIGTAAIPKLRQLLGIDAVHCIFGITEGVIMFTHVDDPLEAIDTTNGRPVSPWDRVRILVPGTETDAEPGQTGEPAFKGPYTTHGYYKAPERNRETFTSDGWYRSGDLMYTKVIDGVTHYVFCGRLKDLVSRGGEKINCEEVEMAVATHPAVAAVAAVGYPDPVFDERLCAVIILRDGHAAPTVEEMGRHLQGYGLAKFKWPERIEIVDAFPLTASGKLSKAALREQVGKKRSIDWSQE